MREEERQRNRKEGRKKEKERKKEEAVKENAEASRRWNLEKKGSMVYHTTYGAPWSPILFFF